MADLNGAGGAKTSTFNFVSGASIENFGAFGTGSAADTGVLPGCAIYTANNVKTAVDQDITVAVA